MKIGMRSKEVLKDDNMKKYFLITTIFTIIMTYHYNYGS